MHLLSSIDCRSFSCALAPPLLWRCLQWRDLPLCRLVRRCASPFDRGLTSPFHQPFSPGPARRARFQGIPRAPWPGFPLWQRVRAAAGGHPPSHPLACALHRSINVSKGPQEDRILTTGRHTVCDIFCIGCDDNIGWFYVRAADFRRTCRLTPDLVPRLRRSSRARSTRKGSSSSRRRRCTRTRSPRSRPPPPRRLGPPLAPAHPALRARPDFVD